MGEGDPPARSRSARCRPGTPDPRYGRFANDRSLSEREDRDPGGLGRGRRALAGDPAEAPAPRELAAGWKIGEPDLVLTMPKPFEVPADGTVEYQYVVFPVGLRRRQVGSRESKVRPGNPAVVHPRQRLRQPAGSAAASRCSTRASFYEFPRPRTQDDPDPFTFPTNGAEALHQAMPPAAAPRSSSRARRAW